MWAEAGMAGTVLAVEGKAGKDIADGEPDREPDRERDRDPDREPDRDPDSTGDPGVDLSRRAALAALAKYSAAVGGSAVTIVSADGLVSAASAYPDYLSDYCHRYPDAQICSDDFWDWWDNWWNRGGGGGGAGGAGGGGGGAGGGGGGPGRGGGRGRIQF